MLADPNETISLFSAIKIVYLCAIVVTIWGAIKFFLVIRKKKRVTHTHK